MLNLEQMHRGEFFLQVHPPALSTGRMEAVIMLGSMAGVQNTFLTNSATLGKRLEEKKGEEWEEEIAKGLKGEAEDREGKRTRRVTREEAAEKLKQRIGEAARRMSSRRKAMRR